MRGEELVATVADRERSLWIGALAFYGVGDTVTTLVGLSVGKIAEAGPVAGSVMDGFGTPGFLVLKVATLLCFYGVWAALRTTGRAAVPLALAIVGVVVTTWNVAVIASAVGA